MLHMYRSIDHKKCVLFLRIFYFYAFFVYLFSFFSYSIFFSNLGRFGRVIVITKDGDPNMIRREVFQELRILDQIIQNTTAYYDDEKFTYLDVCAKWENECFTNDILNLDYIMDEVCMHLYKKRRKEARLGIKIGLSAR